MANSVDPDQTAPIGAVCSWSTLFASILNSSVLLGNYLQQTTSVDDIFRCIFFLALEGLTPHPLAPSTDDFCKQFEPRSGIKTIYHLMVFVKECFENVPS